MTREQCYKTVHSKAQVLNRLIHVNASEYGKFTDRGSGPYGNCQLLIFGVVSRKEYPKLSEKAVILVFHFPTTYPCEKGFSMCFSHDGISRQIECNKSEAPAVFCSARWQKTFDHVQQCQSSYVMFFLFWKI